MKIKGYVQKSIYGEIDINKISLSDFSKGNSIISSESDTVEFRKVIVVDDNRCRLDNMMYLSSLLNTVDDINACNDLKIKNFIAYVKCKNSIYRLEANDVDSTRTSYISDYHILCKLYLFILLDSHGDIVTEDMLEYYTKSGISPNNDYLISNVEEMTIFA